MTHRIDQVWHSDRSHRRASNIRGLLVVVALLSSTGLPSPSRASDDSATIAAILAIEPDLDYGEYLAGECTGCHLNDVTAAGIPSIIGWPREPFIRVMQAYRSKARTHDVMQTIAGALGNEEIASLAQYFSEMK